MKKLLFLLSTICLVLPLIPSAHAQDIQAFLWDSTNGMQALGSLGGDSYATGINDSGQVVGWSYLADQQTSHTFVWTSATGMVDIGTPGGPESIAEGINSAGNVVGFGMDADGKQVAFYWTPADGFLNFSHGGAYGINDSNEVTGQRPIGGSSNHAFLWSPGMRRPRDLGTATGGSDTFGDGINNLRHITGFANDSLGRFQIFAWNNNGGFHLLGYVPGSTDTGGYGINDRDEIVGAGYIASGVLGFYTSASTGKMLLQTLGGNQSAGVAINQTGVIAGYASLPSEIYHATIWATPTSAPQDLGTLGGSNASSSAGAINNLGQVVGSTLVTTP